VSVIGCGQVAYATHCYFIRQQQGSVFLDCFDPDRQQARNLQQVYQFETIAPTAAAVFRNPRLKAVWITSNHASHSAYAVEALQHNHIVFCEKPLATTFDQLVALDSAINGKAQLFHAGFNRPFAPATQVIADAIRNTRQPISLHCVVHGHFLPEDHWYRQPGEGTRICGNMGHWIDLAVYLMAVRGSVPETVALTLRSSETTLPKDDNVVLVMTTDTGDLISISLNARHEPFGGVDEIISFQSGTFKAHIDDFRSIRFSSEQQERAIRYRHKDVGHAALVASVFEPSAVRRSWDELRLSTALTLHAAELARTGTEATVHIRTRPLVLSL
jgi:predicted dehydrogenase